MGRWQGSLASAGMALFFASLALAATGKTVPTPDSLGRLFLTVEILAGPFAVMFGIMLRDWLTLWAEDGTAAATLRLRAHGIGLSIAGFCGLSALYFLWVWSNFRPEAVGSALPQVMTTLVAAGTGLAWGALWRLPRPGGEENP